MERRTGQGCHYFSNFFSVSDLELMDLDLSLFEPQLCGLARAAFEEGNAGGFLLCAGNHYGLSIVRDNLLQLLERGIYEPALLTAYTGCRGNNRHWPTTTLQRLFNLADRAKLRAAGDPLPDGDRFTIYRGVSGSSYYRKVRSFSWTLDRERAEWFAHRFDVLGLADPAVYRAVVRREQVLAFFNGRQEQEIIGRPWRCERMPAALRVAA
jgi:hypothetical protein